MADTDCCPVFTRLLSIQVPKATVEAFVEEVMDLVELTTLKNVLVGLPGVSGLSVEQRKRLTIAVELVCTVTYPSLFRYHVNPGPHD